MCEARKDDASKDEDRRVDISEDSHGDPDAAPPPPPVGGLEGDRPWRIAESLEVLRRRINELAPTRDKSSDGGIGDAAHASRSSDHNPWIVEAGEGVVTARDFTHSPATGCDAGVIAEELRASRDPRIKYIIWNRRICASEARDGQPPWAWRPYAGANPHNHHVHVSVQPDKPRYDDARPFALDSVAPLGAQLAAPSPAPSTRAAPGPATSMDEQIADIVAATERLARRVGLRELLVDLKDSADESVAQEASELLTRYLALTRNAVAAAGQADSETFDLPTLRLQYETLFAACKVRPEWKGQVQWYCTKLMQYRPRYESIQKATGVPWWVVGAIHAMEGSFDFNTHLHNGDPLTARTVNVPKDRPQKGTPPFTWEVSAIDALTQDGLAGQADWSLPATLFRLESYNGFGSRRIGINTPYLWSFSNHYEKGKFVRDRVYDPQAVSKQCGAAVMIRALVDAGVICV